jgi:ABC-type branched-subunit amino acid transport system ATPase component
LSKSNPLKAIVKVEQNSQKALLIAGRGYVLEKGGDRLEGSGESFLDNLKVG